MGRKEKILIQIYLPRIKIQHRIQKLIKRRRRGRDIFMFLVFRLFLEKAWPEERLGEKNWKEER